MSPWKLREAARVLRGGGVLAYPTEAVYGLGCDPLDAEAVYRVLSLKGRAVGKGLILIGSDFSQLAPFVAELPPQRRGEVEASWPGPVTWLLPAHPGLPRWLRGVHETIAVRVTAHPLAASLCRAFGAAIVSTSANPSGRTPARSPLTVRRYFDDRVDSILHGSLGGRARPSEIRDGISGDVIRGG